MERIHSFESLAAVDGDGIRYAIFFPGCKLRCIYCHNPDTWGQSGKEYSAEEVVAKVKRYKTYFNKTGGVTFSGGEPLLHAKFINELNVLLEVEGIKYDLDTSGYVELNQDVKEVINNADLVILDLKFWDNNSYKKYTGGDFDIVLKFAKYLDLINKRTWVRTVIVPGINDEQKILNKYLNIVKQFKNVEKYELLGFHTMGFYKYEQLGVNNPLEGVKDLDCDILKVLQDYINLEMRNGRDK